MKQATTPSSVGAFLVTCAQNSKIILEKTKERYFAEQFRPTYTGPYDVTPMVSEQTLDTSGKIMQKDVEVAAIPFYQVSNPSGGSTIFIGNEV